MPQTTSLVAASPTTLHALGARWVLASGMIEQRIENEERKSHSINHAWCTTQVYIEDRRQLTLHSGLGSHAVFPLVPYPLALLSLCVLLP